jgi:hypothetical protein
MSKVSAPGGPVQISNREFLEVVFGKARAGEAHTVSVPGDPGKTTAWTGMRARKNKQIENPGLNQYFAVSQCWDTPDGSARRLEALFRCLVCVVADDVGSPKVDKAGLAKMPKPTWVLETSPGNFQFGWKLDMPEPDFGRAKALLELLKKHKITDQGTVDVVRLMRLPRGINGKVGYGSPSPDVVLHELDREWCVTPDEIAVALGETLPGPGTAAVPSMWQGTPVDAAVAAEDVVLAAMDELGAVGHLRSSGWGYDCACPCADEHTDGRDSGCGYRPGPRGHWVCHHTHCKGRHWEDYYAGLERALAAAGLPPMRAREFAVVADDDPEVARWVRELGAVPIKLSARDAFLSDIVFSKPDNMFYSLSRRVAIPRPSINSVYAGDLGRDLAYDDGKGGHKYMQVDKWFFQQPEHRVIDGLTYWPGQPGVFEHEGSILANRYRPVSVVDPGRRVATREIGPWLDLVKHVLGAEGPRAVVWFLDWCAGVVAQPDLKPGWMVVLQGTQGIGKDMVLKPILAGVGPGNSTSIDADTLGSGFTGYAERRLLVVKELRQTSRGASTGHDQYNRLKWLVDATAETLSVNPKYGRPFEARNVVAVAVTTNELDAVALDPADRRALVYVSKADKWDAGRYLDLLHWLDHQDGTRLVTWWLRQWWARIGQNRRKAVGGNAPRTRGREAMIAAAGGPVFAWVRAQIEQDATPDWPDVMTAAAVVANVTRALANPASGLPRHYKAPSQDQAGRWLAQLGGVRLAGGKPVRTKKLGQVRLWGIRDTLRFDTLGQAALAKLIDEDRINEFEGPQVVEGQFGGERKAGSD